MFTIQIADLAVEIHNRYPYVEALCEEYKVTGKPIDFSVTATDEEMEEEMNLTDHQFPMEYAEATCLHRQIARRLSEYGAFLLHSAVISCDGEGYAFAARSGVGKSTHIALWLKNFGDRVCVVNGDKPILRRCNGGFRVYGTPWNGKERLGANVSCKMKALCFLERGATNQISEISGDEALLRLFSQVYLPEDAIASAATLDLLGEFIQNTKFYLLHCNMEDQAAIVAYHGMNKE